MQCTLGIAACNKDMGTKIDTGRPVSGHEFAIAFKDWRIRRSITFYTLAIAQSGIFPFIGMQYTKPRTVPIIEFTIDDEMKLTARRVTVKKVGELDAKTLDSMEAAHRERQAQGPRPDKLPCTVFVIAQCGKMSCPVPVVIAESERDQMEKPGVWQELVDWAMFLETGKIVPVDGWLHAMGIAVK